MSTRELLVEYAVLLNRHGADSPEAEAFLAAHRDDAEFVDLARVARELKAALASVQRE
jgi:hypothetical protein